MRLIALLGSLFIRALHATLRIRHVRVENILSTPQYILAFWHAHLLLMLHSRYRRPITVMISQSKDGEYIARVFDHYDVDSARGSSTRGGSAARGRLVRGSAPRAPAATSSSRRTDRRVPLAWPRTAWSSRRRLRGSPSC